MSEAPSRQETASTAFDPRSRFEVVIVGAGACGLYMLHRMRQKGISVRLFEAGTGVGGTWYWNRYPGARVDLESLEYSYSFSEELQQEWKWSERYAAQPELQRYFDHVADRFGLKQDIQFSTRVTSAVFDETTRRWNLRTDRGDEIVARFCIMATGFLSAANKPPFPGLDSFRGKQYQTGRWPREGVDFTGQRVAVIGTGSSAVQSIPIIAQQASHLYVFQRTPAFSIPLRNEPLDPEFERCVKADYKDWRRRQLESMIGAVAVNNAPAEPSTQRASELSPETRRKEYESRWKSGGLCLATTYADLFIDLDSNEELAEFVRDKTRRRVRDPAVAELLTPRDYPILTKRLCADTNYYETYDRDNVTLVSIKNSPIEAITPDGLQVGGREYPVDAIVFATGFDAVTGALNNIDIRGREGKKLRSYWNAGPRAYLGLMSVGFPNLFYMDGPCAPGALFNPILLGEYQADWIERCLAHLDALSPTACIEPRQDEEDGWLRHLNELGDGTLLSRANSWYLGANIAGKPRTLLVYVGGYALYRQRCEEAAANGFGSFEVRAA